MKFHTLLQAYEKHLHKVWHHGLLVAWLSIVGIGLIFSYQALSNSSHARYIKSTLQTVSNRLAPNPALDEVPRPLTGIILDDEPEYLSGFYSWGDIIIDSMSFVNTSSNGVAWPINTIIDDSDNALVKVTITFKNIGITPLYIPYYPRSLDTSTQWIGLSCYYNRGNWWYTANIPIAWLTQLHYLTPWWVIQWTFDMRWSNFWYSSNWYSNNSNYLRCEVTSQQQQRRDPVNPSMYTTALFETNWNNNIYIIDSVSNSTTWQVSTWTIQTWNNSITTDLSLTKSSSVFHESAASWTILKYMLTVTNNGSANINLPFTVTDLVWEYWWYLNVNSCSLACTTYPSASHPGLQNASWTIPSLWAYQSYTITYNVYVDPSITTYTNQACVNVTWWIIDTNYNNNCMSISYNPWWQDLSLLINTGTNNTSTWVIYGYGYGYQPWYGYGYGYGYMGGRYGANKPYFYLTKPYLMISEKIYKKFKDVYTTRIKKLSKTVLMRLFDKKTLRTMKRDVEIYLTKQIQSIASSKVLTVSQRLEQLRKFATYKWQAQVQYKELIDKK